MWLTFRSRDLAAGDYHAAITVGDLASFEPPIETPVTLTVYPMRLPDRVSYHHINWVQLAGIQDDERREAVTRDALDHHTTVFCIPQVTVRVDLEGHPISGDTESHDRLVNRLKGKAFLLIEGAVGIAWPSGAKPDGALQERAFAEALRWYGEHMTSLGVDYSEYALYPVDEPGIRGHDKAFEAFIALVNRIKAAEPRILVYADVTGGANAQVIQPIKDLIDAWCPDLHLVREHPDEAATIFKHGKQYWHYEAPDDQRNLNPLGFYRMKPWVAFGLGMNGGGWYIYNGGENAWFFDPNHDEYGTAYFAESGTVSTKRWEAARQGIEDYELLRMLREAAQHDASPKGWAALDLLNETVAFVTKGQDHVSDISRQLRPYTPDFDQWTARRDRLIQAFVALSR